MYRFNRWTPGTPEEYEKFTRTKYTRFFSLDVLEPARSLVIRLHFDDEEKKPVDLKDLFEDMRLEFNFLETGTTLKRIDHNKDVLYHVMKSGDCVAVDYGSKYSLRRERAMTPAEIKKLCDVFSGGIADFDEVSYSRRHFFDDVGRLLGTEDRSRKRKYTVEKVGRAMLKEKITESLDQIRGKAHETAT